jgi:hypothetical protein
MALVLACLGFKLEFKHASKVCVDLYAKLGGKHLGKLSISNKLHDLSNASLLDFLLDLAKQAWMLMKHTKLGPRYVRLQVGNKDVLPSDFAYRTVCDFEDSYFDRLSVLLHEAQRQGMTMMYDEDLKKALQVCRRAGVGIAHHDKVLSIRDIYEASRLPDQLAVYSVVGQTIPDCVFLQASAVGQPSRRNTMVQKDMSFLTLMPSVKTLDLGILRPQNIYSLANIEYLCVYSRVFPDILLLGQLRHVLVDNFDEYTFSKHHDFSGLQVDLTVSNCDAKTNIMTEACTKTPRITALCIQCDTQPSEAQRSDRVGMFIRNTCAWRNIPASIYKLSNLTELSLPSHGLCGNIPTEIGQLASLAVLNLSNNALTGMIPPELGQATKLQSIDLCDNALQGGIPSELGNLLRLERFTARRNALVGPVPDDIKNLPKLLTFWSIL